MRILLYIFTGVYAVLGIQLHVPVSRLVSGKYPHILGQFVPRDHAVVGSIPLLVGFLLFIGFKAWKGERRQATFLYLGIYALTLVLFYQFLSLHPVEVVHLVHYSVLAYLLGLCLDRDRRTFRLGTILCIAGSIGSVDEILQFYITAPGHKYLDLADFVVNLLGTVGGLLMFYGFRRAPTWDERPVGSVFRTVEFRSLGLVAVVLGSLWLAGYIDTSPPGRIAAGSVARIGDRSVVFLERDPGRLGSWFPHHVSGVYYVLTPGEGLAALLLVGLLFSSFDPRMPQALAGSLTGNKGSAARLVLLGANRVLAAIHPSGGAG